MERFSKKFHTTTSNKKYNRNPRLKKKSQTITSNHNLISNYPKSHSVHPKGTSKITLEWQKNSTNTACWKSSSTSNAFFKQVWTSDPITREKELEGMGTIGRDPWVLITGNGNRHGHHQQSNCTTHMNIEVKQSCIRKQMCFCVVIVSKTYRNAEWEREIGKWERRKERGLTNRLWKTGSLKSPKK